MTASMTPGQGAFCFWYPRFKKTRAPPRFSTSRIAFGLARHRRRIEAVDLVDQLVGDHVLDVDRLLDDAPFQHEVVVGGVVRLVALAPPFDPGLLELPLVAARQQRLGLARYRDGLALPARLS